MNSIGIPALRFVARAEGQPEPPKSAGIRIPPDQRPGFLNGKAGEKKESHSPKGQKPPPSRRRGCCLILASRMPFCPGLGKAFRITKDYENHKTSSTNELGKHPKKVPL